MHAPESFGAMSVCSVSALWADADDGSKLLRVHWQLVASFGGLVLKKIASVCSEFTLSPFSRFCRYFDACGSENTRTLRFSTDQISPLWPVMLCVGGREGGCT